MKSKWFRNGFTRITAAALLLGSGAAIRAEQEHQRGNSFDHQLKEHVRHVIVIYQENWSFDSLYGQFPGVNGLQNGFDTLPQLDKTGGYTNYLYVTPQALNGGPDLRFPPGNGQLALPLIPYDFTKYVSASNTTGDIVHRFYHEQLQIDNGVLEPSLGALDKFVTWSDNPGLVLSYLDATDLPEGKLAQRFTICDNFFHSAYGGSFLNHQFLAAAAAPKWRQPIPAGFQSSWDSSTRALNDSNLTIDGQYVVNTSYGAQTPHPASVPANKLLAPVNNVDPSQPDFMPTIGNRLDDAGVSWKWYSGGWSNAVAGSPDPLFQFHHQPFGYYAKYAPFNPDGTLNPATTGPNAHLQDEQALFGDLAHGSLPAVSFIKPLGPDNEHPGYADVLRGQEHVAALVAAVQHSSAANNTVIIITYDENGGRWDHVAPPVMADGWGLGTRVPAIIVSPFTQGGVIDSNQYETVSILKLIERRFGLAPLSSRDANPAVSDLSTAFRFPKAADVE
jgi:phospholipase C